MARILSWFSSFKLPFWVGPVLLLALYAFTMSKVYDAGVDAERGRHALEENTKIAALGERIITLQNQKHELEQKRVKDLDALTLNFQEKIKNVETKSNDAISAVRAGTLKLRIPIKVYATDCAGGASPAGTIASGVVGDGNAELSERASEFLIGQANKADKVVAALQLCKAIAIADRKTQLNTTSNISTQLTGELN